MKTVILAGGLGTRLSEETTLKPKPMVEVGGRPLLWHILNIYAAYDLDEFVLALGYKSEVVKEYFLNFYALNNDLSIDLAHGGTTVHHGQQPKWNVHLVNTGLHTQTGGRIKYLQKWLGNETFMMTYGDGVADINIHKLLAFHKAHGKLATVTAVRPPARFGALRFEGDHITEFMEKPQTGEGWINGGFFVLEPEVLDFITDENTIWEREPLEKLAFVNQLIAYKHDGFWQPMDTIRDKRLLETLWESGQAPWRVW
ncbi:glucose-1-phosphate cytidylyltransferase [Anthocerotibacter panamensis]|uniref:glucose-1-phosphate cytidylyltransferase n=1 Tax=Anthocerotibacter panamensis TaxID=2857077 RepID=UPI001C402495|nr:glucose-1-phosphate cytidylyltransferase [Anthocerotibacter panamensis]